MALPTPCRQALRLATRCKSSRSSILFRIQPDLPLQYRSLATERSRSSRANIAPSRAGANEADVDRIENIIAETGGFGDAIEQLEQSVAPHSGYTSSSSKSGRKRAAQPDPDPDEGLPEILRTLSPQKRELIAKARIPKSLQAMFNRPLKRKPTHGIPVCSLQIRSFSVRNLELQADFAMRAAYYLGLPAKGPVPLPHITQRWTVPKANFIFKKAQENFERITLRRLIQIQDGDLEVVQCWLGYLRQRSYHGVGMKAYMWENEALGVGKRMDEAAGDADASLDEDWGNFGMRLNVKTAEAVEDLLGSEAFSKPKRDSEAYWREPVEVVRKPAASTQKKA